MSDMDGRERGNGPWQQQYPPAHIAGSARLESTEKRAAFAIASMVLGIVNVLFFWIPGLGLIIAAIGTSLGGLSLAKHLDGRGMAVTGLVLGILGIVWQVGWFILLGIGAASS